MRRSSLLALTYLICSALGMSLVLHAQNESLLIGPGDLVQVDVLDTPEMEQQVRVSDSGTISLAYVGTVQVAGETPAKAAALIQSLLIQKEVMRHPQVTVRIQEYATQDVSVLGQVKSPGSYSIATPQTVLKVLSLAGGLSEVADRHITIRRKQDGKETTYYVANDAKDALEDVPIVRPGDIILVPRAPMIYILGDVSRPGGYAIATNDSHLSILQAIAMAGSANKTSVQSHVRLIRTTPSGQVETPVHLDAIEKGKQPDIAMQANDILYVPFSWVKNTAMSSASIVSSTTSAAIYVVH
jgi:polysaccharide biosynthesis/export protein